MWLDFMLTQAQNPQSGTCSRDHLLRGLKDRSGLGRSDRLLGCGRSASKPARIVTHFQPSIQPHQVWRDTKHAPRRQTARKLRGAVRGTMALAVQSGKRGARVRERYTGGTDDRRVASWQRRPLTTRPQLQVSKNATSHQ